MKNLRNSPLKFCLTALAVAVTAAGCAKTVKAPKEAFDQLRCVADEKVGVPRSVTRAPETGVLDMNAQADISEQCVKAWRMAGDGDGKGALAILDKLESQYPNVSTVHMMKGQVLDRLGRKKEAVKFYQQSALQSDFSALHLFKYAESLRTTGDAKAAIPQFRKLLQMAPGYAPARLSLARCLNTENPHSAEAIQYVEDVLNTDPDNQQAKQLLSELKK
ncbi:MAG TPA: tetratricopeptide repeat protein [Chroococcales cyanobacterium]